MLDARCREHWSHTSVILALIANVNRDPKKHSQPFSPDEFNPYEQQSKAKEEPIARVGVDMLRRLFIDGNGARG